MVTNNERKNNEYPYVETKVLGGGGWVGGKTVPVVGVGGDMV